MNRSDAQTLNPMIGPDVLDTIDNLARLLDGQSELIADRAIGARLDGEPILYLLSTVSSALKFERQLAHVRRQSPHTANGNLASAHECRSQSDRIFSGKTQDID